jgi:hypothetical protein
MWFSSRKTRCNTHSEYVITLDGGTQVSVAVSAVDGVRQAFLPSSLRASSMKRFHCGLAALCLFLGMAGQGKGQPTYSFATLTDPCANSATLKWQSRSGEETVN